MLNINDLPGQSTMEMQATSGQFNAELFALANNQNFEEVASYMVPFTEIIELKAGTNEYIIHTDAAIVNSEAYPVTIEGMTAAASAESMEAGTFHCAASVAAEGGTGFDTTITFGSWENDEQISTVDVTYYVAQSVKQIKIDNKSTAVGSLIAKWPVYASGEEGVAAGVKGYLLMEVHKCRVTAMPGFDTSYKSAATNSVTFSTVESRTNDDAYRIAYYETGKAA